MKRYVRSNQVSNLSPIFATHYDEKAAELLAKSGLFDAETSNKIIQTLFREDIPTFHHAPNFLEKYLKGIARMIVEESEGDPEKASNFIATATPVFDKYLGYVTELRDKLGGAEYDAKFMNEMHFSDVEKEIQDFNEKYYNEVPETTSNESGSDYMLVPIHNYDEFHTMFGGHWTGDGSSDLYAGGGGTAWCHTNSESVYDSWTSNGNKFFVLAKKNWKDIPFNRETNSQNPKDEYGNSLIALRVDKRGELLNATLRCNHVGVSSNADSQYKTYGQLSSLAGFDVEESIEQYFEDPNPNSPYYEENDKYRMLKSDKIKFKGHTLYRIQAVKSFASHDIIIQEGDLGGYIEAPDNLSVVGGAWVSNGAKVFDSAYVYGDAFVGGKAIISGNARIHQNAIVSGNVKASGNVNISENAKVYENVKVAKNARIFGYTEIYGSATITGDAYVYGHAHVYGNPTIDGYSKVYEIARVYGNAQINDHAQIYDHAQVFEDAIVTRNAKIYGDATIHGSAKICGRSEISGTADVCERAIIYNGNFDSGIIIKSNI